MNGSLNAEVRIWNSECRKKLTWMSVKTKFNGLWEPLSAAIDLNHGWKPLLPVSSLVT